MRAFAGKGIVMREGGRTILAVGAVILVFLNHVLEQDHQRGCEPWACDTWVCAKDFHCWDRVLSKAFD